jgi:hypothetical protein
MLATRRHLVLLVALAALIVPAKAQAGGGAYVFSSGSEAARAQVRAALEARSFDWSLVPATVRVRIANCGCAGSSPRLIVLDETLLASAPYGRAYSWAKLAGSGESNPVEQGNGRPPLSRTSG